MQAQGRTCTFTNPQLKNLASTVKLGIIVAMLIDVDPFMAFFMGTSTWLALIFNEMYYIFIRSKPV